MTKELVPAHHMPFACFTQVARLKKLENHGRAWEVFLHGRSLGFADGSQEEATRQAHSREVNNALYLNQTEIVASDAPIHMPCSMPSAAALADHPDLADKFTDVIKENAVSAWSDALSRQQFDAYIKAAYQEFSERICSLVTVPEGHAWRENGSDALRWFLGDAVLSTESGMSFFIGRSTADDTDENQISVEVRYFWQGRNVVEKGQVSFYGQEKHRVTLWCEQGRPFMGQHRSLLGDTFPFFYHDTIESLAGAVAETINQAITGLTTQAQVGVAA